MKNLLIATLSMLFLSTIFISRGDNIVRVISAENRDALPFSVITIDDTLYLSADSAGVAKIPAYIKGEGMAKISSFNHKSKILSVKSLCSNSNDTSVVTLEPTFITLSEASVRPLVKEKEFIRGWTDPSKATKWNMRLHYPVGDTIEDRKKKWRAPGIQINTKKNKLAVLDAFGANIINTDSLPEKFYFKISIYDVSGKRPANMSDIPEPVYDPIIITLLRDSITDEGFRYKFPEPIPLPSKAAILVDYPEYICNVDEHIDFAFGFDCNWFEHCNPYYVAKVGPFGIMSYSLSPFYWEYSQYLLPKE